jgi:hypothetical protein
LLFAAYPLFYNIIAEPSAFASHQAALYHHSSLISCILSARASAGSRSMSLETS